MNWQPTASLAMLRQRAEALTRLRGFFAARGVLEVETPVLGAAGCTDPNIPSYAASMPDGALAGWLQTSPELPMKRLLAAGSGPIWQLARVFRAGEAGRWHNPEFSLLEWYRPGWDHHALMAEVAELVQHLLGQQLSVQRLRYADALQQLAGLQQVDTAGCRTALLQHGVALPAAEMDLDSWLDLLMSTVVGPQLGQDGLCFLYDYPASQAALARVENGVALRFELYYCGVELANGFNELTDATEQRRRFEEDNQQRAARGMHELPLDESFLAALDAGMPASSGVALGWDRLLMQMTNAKHVAEVMAFAAQS